MKFLDSESYLYDSQGTRKIVRYLGKREHFCDVSVIYP